MTNDLYDERDQILAYLQQYGAKVLPEGDYKQGGPEFAEAFKDRPRAGRVVRPAAGPVPFEPPAGS